MEDFETKRQPFFKKWKSSIIIFLLFLLLLIQAIVFSFFIMDLQTQLSDKFYSPYSEYRSNIGRIDRLEDAMSTVVKGKLSTVKQLLTLSKKQLLTYISSIKFRIWKIDVNTGGTLRQQSGQAKTIYNYLVI